MSLTAPGLQPMCSILNLFKALFELFHSRNCLNSLRIPSPPSFVAWGAWWQTTFYALAGRTTGKTGSTTGFGRCCPSCPGGWQKERAEAGLRLPQGGQQSWELLAPGGMRAWQGTLCRCSPPAALPLSGGAAARRGAGCPRSPV